MHTYTQMLSAVPIFSDASHSQVRQSLSTRRRQPPWNPHTLFHSPISKPSTFFPINFLKPVFTGKLFLFGSEVCDRNLNFKKRSAWDHHMSNISIKAFLAYTHTHIHTHTGWSIVSPPALRQATSCSSCLQQAGPPLVSPSACSPLFQLSS